MKFNTNRTQLKKIVSQPASQEKYAVFFDALRKKHSSSTDLERYGTNIHAFLREINTSSGISDAILHNYSQSSHNTLKPDQFIRI